MSAISLPRWNACGVGVVMNSTSFTCISYVAPMRVPFVVVFYECMWSLESQLLQHFTVHSESKEEP